MSAARRANARLPILAAALVLVAANFIALKSAAAEAPLVVDLATGKIANTQPAVPAGDDADVVMEVVEILFKAAEKEEAPEPVLFPVFRERKADTSGAWLLKMIERVCFQNNDGPAVAQPTELDIIGTIFEQQEKARKVDPWAPKVEMISKGVRQLISLIALLIPEAE